MPRASWKGFLRLSLVSCPVYLSPATSRTKSIRLNQVWVPQTRPAGPVEAEEDEEPAHISRGRGVSQGAAELAAEAEEEPEYPAPATRIALRPHDHAGTAVHGSNAGGVPVRGHAAAGNAVGRAVSDQI